MEETEGRRQAFYEKLMEKARRKGVYYVLSVALGRYGLNRELERADRMLVEKYPQAYAAQIEKARKLNRPWYNFGREARLYFLFGSRSKLHPGRMSPAAEKVLLETMWTWAQATLRADFTRPERDTWVLGSENHWSHLWTGMWGAAQIFADHPDYRKRRTAATSTRIGRCKAKGCWSCNA